MNYTIRVETPTDKVFELKMLIVPQIGEQIKLDDRIYTVRNVRHVYSSSIGYVETIVYVGSMY